MPDDEPSDEQILARFPEARIDHDNKHYYRGLLQRRLLVLRCRNCRHWILPPRSLCPRCWSESVAAEPVSGRGHVHLLMRLWQGPAAPSVDYSRPYPVAAVELDEQPGLRVSAAIVGAEGQELRIGMPVELDWTERQGAPFPVFRPARRGA
jgi:uncharacterized OB-fold protein